MAIAYFSTWTTYGTWLPGDERGWFEVNKGVQPADLARQFAAALRMTQSAAMLDLEQRRLVEATIRKHCEMRKWTLHAVNCRSNHVHAVVTAPDIAIEIPREQFKSWCTRKLKELEKFRQGRATAVRDHWWTERGWDIFLDHEEQLFDTVVYVKEGQDCQRDC